MSVSAPVSVRLLADGQYVHNGVVELQIPEGSGWRTIAKAATGAYGMGRATISVTRDTRIRAYYRGSTTRTTATSSTSPPVPAIAPTSRTYISLSFFVVAMKTGPVVRRR